MNVPVVSFASSSLKRFVGALPMGSPVVWVHGNLEHHCHSPLLGLVGFAEVAEVNAVRVGAW